MEKTLIIHPDDRTTDFLKPIYEDIPYKTIISGGISRFHVLSEIKSHDRIIMMGHGSPMGLFGINFDCTYIIDERAVDILRGKENYFIWCHASDFVRRLNLKGFSTGMFISETSEANYYNVKASKQDVDHSNEVFAALMRKHIMKEQTLAYNIVSNAYDTYAKESNNGVAMYNHERLILL
jgi:hypothetical protein